VSDLFIVMGMGFYRGRNFSLTPPILSIAANIFLFQLGYHTKIGALVSNGISTVFRNPNVHRPQHFELSSSK